MCRCRSAAMSVCELAQNQSPSTGSLNGMQPSLMLEILPGAFPALTSHNVGREKGDLLFRRMLQLCFAVKLQKCFVH